MSCTRRDNWISMYEQTLQDEPTVPNDVLAIGEEADIALAARLMREKERHYLLVTDNSVANDQNVIGVLTEGDIVTGVVAREADPRSVRVADVMRRLVSPVPMARVLALLPEKAPHNVIRIKTQYSYLHAALASRYAVQRMLRRLRDVAHQLRGESPV